MKKCQKTRVKVKQMPRDKLLSHTLLYEYEHKRLQHKIKVHAKIANLPRKMRKGIFFSDLYCSTLFINGKFSSLVCSPQAGMVAHPVTQVIGKQAIVDIMDLSKVS